MALVQYATRLSLDEALHLHGTYRRSYPKVPIWWQHQIARGRRLGYAETLAGRRVTVEGNWSSPQLKWFMESTMVNYPIQGTGGEQKYLAFRVLSNILAKYGARFAWDMHDGIYFYCPKAKSQAFAIEGTRLLDHLPYERAWGFKSPIPLPWEAKVGPSWGELKDAA